MNGLNRLAGKVAIVTGGGRGIGKAVALAYAGEGADVALVARSAAEIAQAAGEVQALGRRAMPIACDVTEAAEVQNMVGRVLAELGRVDILFNAAGSRAVFPSAELAYADWQRVIGINLTGSFLCSQAVYEPMKRAGGGKIIMVGSMQAHSGAPARAAYIASKTGLVGLARGLGVEWAADGINVNVLSPGYFATDAIKRQIAIGQLNLAAIEQRTPMKRLGTMADLLGPAIFLASAESDFMCGQSLIIDGGWLAYGFLQG